MQGVFEKIIEKLGEEEVQAYAKIDGGDTYKAFRNAIAIVDQAATEYNNGWIPCSERLPEDNGYYEVTFEYTRSEKIEYKTWRVRFENGYWLTQFNVIAWQPLPEPYQPKGE